MPSYGKANVEYAMRMATTAPEDDGPVWMVNLMKYREQADYGDGESQGLTGREADDAYTPVGPLAAIGAEIVYAAEVEMTPSSRPANRSASICRRSEARKPDR